MECCWSDDGYPINNCWGSVGLIICGGVPNDLSRCWKDAVGSFFVVECYRFSFTLDSTAHRYYWFGFTFVANSLGYFLSRVSFGELTFLIELWFESFVWLGFWDGVWLVELHEYLGIGWYVVVDNRSVISLAWLVSVSCLSIGINISYHIFCFDYYFFVVNLCSN